jgi:hypothetical protein
VSRILLLDIETAPHRAYVWGLRNDYIPIDRLVEHGYTLCWSAKWLGERQMMFDSLRDSKAPAMLRRIHKLLDEADAVVHFNGRKFDIPTLQGEFVRHGMAPPAPFKHIDLLVTCRRQFRFASNKLDYVSQLLGLGQKAQHKGMALWYGCMANDPAAWRVMERYNKQDVRLLEKLHDQIRPWIKGYPNQAMGSDERVCPKCGGQHHQQRQVFETATRRYAKFQCVTRQPHGGICGAWFRSTHCQPGSAKFVEAA